MATQWMDDFTSYGTGSSSSTNMTNGVYAEAGDSCLLDPDPHGSGLPVLRVSPTNGGTVGCRKVLFANKATVGVACRQWLTGLPTASSQWPMFASFRSQENIQHLYVSVDPSGYLYVARSDNAGDVQIATSPSPVVIANAWTHYEIKVVFSSTTTGSVEVRQEGISLFTVTGIRTTTDRAGATASCASVATFNKGSSGFGPAMYIKDFIIWDGDGSVNNTFFGSCQVYKCTPDSDVSLGWATSSGTTGWNLINESTPDDDTNYISAATASLSSAFTLTDTPADTSSVKSVMTVHRSRKIDGGDGNAKVSLINGGTAVGTDRPLTTAYTYWYDVFDIAPDGGAWTKAKIDATEFEITRTV